MLGCAEIELDDPCSALRIIGLDAGFALILFAERAGGIFVGIIKMLFRTSYHFHCNYPPTIITVCIDKVEIYKILTLCELNNFIIAFSL